MHRAHHDGFARYRDVSVPDGFATSDFAKRDAYRRYDTGEPHPTDGEANRIVGYIDSSTRWQMYRHDEDTVQPEDEGVARYDPAAAAEQRDRWVAAAREALELEASGERRAHHTFTEPCLSNSDEEMTLRPES
eukprot:1163580-Pleurochrysis_carterae.AAC.1